jgi:hypothetical protein
MPPVPVIDRLAPVVVDPGELARHSTIALTMDRYAHVTFDEVAAVARIQALPEAARLH